MRGIRKKPLGALLALEEGTKLAVHGIGDVLLQRGDCLVFDGDLVHAGSAYPDAPNTRVHVYLDVPTVERRRTVRGFLEGGAKKDDDYRDDRRGLMWFVFLNMEIPLTRATTIDTTVCL